MTKQRVAIIQTSSVSTSHLGSLFKELLPDVEVINIVDDSLLPEVVANGSPTNAVIRRITAYAQAAEAAGASVILNQCSSVGEVVDVASQTIGIPYVKVDMPMARKAVELGERITVVATVRSTLGPSVRLVERAAADAGKTVTVKELLVDGALDVLMKQGDRELHNKMVLDAIAAAEKTSDVVVLAQGSMAILEPELKQFSKPVLTSPRLGVEQIKALLAR
ncbi:aspartate/glutamate racemase family protein [Rhizobium giardinii]|uniref:aspartate/glutamate racemase family protein n=1 Tax=Rhizobium giardinii TaxID=56731 RepID=UPI0039E1D91B